MTAELECPVSNKCVWKKHCFLAEQMQEISATTYSRTRRQAQDNIGRNNGPFVRISRWNHHKTRAKKDARVQSCGQITFFDNEIDQLSREKKYRGELA